MKHFVAVGNQMMAWMALGLLSACAHRGPSYEKIQESFREQQKNWRPTGRTGPFVPLELAFSGHVAGSFSSCGCSVNPKGGADRRVYYIREERTRVRPQHLWVADAGNTLFPTTSLDPGQALRERQRAEWILKAHAAMEVAAQNVGLLDLAAGKDFLRQQAEKWSVPLLSTNLKNSDGSPWLPETITVVDSAGTSVVFVGLAGSGDWESFGLQRENPAMALERILKEIPEQSLVVVLSDLGQVEDDKLAYSLKRATLWVQSRDLNSLERPRQVGRALFVRPQIQGQQWARVRLAWRPGLTGWSESQTAELYWKRWELLSADQKDEAREEFSPYIGGNPTHKAPVDYRSVDMTLEYEKPNEFSAMVKELSQPL